MKLYTADEIVAWWTNLDDQEQWDVIFEAYLKVATEEEVYGNQCSQQRSVARN